MTDLTAFIADRLDVLERVRGILVRRLGVRREPAEIDPDTPLFGTGLGLDSVDGVELLVAIEVEFDVRVPNDAARIAFRTVNCVVDTVLGLRESHAAA
jgi:acyl carrier protein